MNKLALLLLGTLISSCYLGEELPPDQEVWEYSSPAAVGMETGTLFELDDELMRGDFGFVKGMIIIKDDQLVFENYYDDETRADLQNMGRLSFSTIVLAMDIFIENQLIDSLEQPIYTFLPEYQNIFDADTIKKLITFHDILSNKIGLAWDETGRVIDDYGQMKATEDWVKHILSKPRDTPLPGQRFSINAAGGIILARIMQNILEDQDLETYLQEHLFDKIGIRNIMWEKSPQGTINAANGLQLSAMDMTRIGYLMLLEGRWTEKRRVLNRDWIFDVSNSQTIFSNRINFGYGWKILTEEYKDEIGLSGTSTYYIDGGQGQGLFIIPEFKLILSITAENFFDNAESLSFALFLDTLQSLQEGAAP